MVTSLKHKTISGVKWVLVGSFGQRMIAFVTTMILARILTPADFGLFALAFVMIDGFSIFKSLGFGPALIRRKDDIELACDTAFYIIPLVGIILCGSLFLLAPLCASAFGEPAVTNIIRALAFVFVISCFGKVPQTRLNRSMKFKYKSIGQLTGYVIYSVTALVLAFRGYGVWSLVFAYLARTLTQISIEWYFSGWKPGFRFDKDIAWDMFHFGKYVLGGAILTFLMMNLDNILIGKILGITMLGYYAIARNLANFLALYFIRQIGVVMYPAYSEIQNDREAIIRVLFKMTRMISIIVFPFAFGLFIFAPEILVLIFGEKWLPATNVLRVLAWSALFKSIGSAIWPIFLAKGQSKINFTVNSISTGIFFIFVIPLTIQFGLVGTSLAVLASSVISLSIGIVRVSRLLKFPVSKFFDSVQLAFLSSSVMLLVGFVLKGFTIDYNGKLNILLSGGLALGIYFLVTHLIDKNLIHEIKDNLFQRKPSLT